MRFYFGIKNILIIVIHNKRHDFIYQIYNFSLKIS
jgi:hypothetical protein